MPGATPTRHFDAIIIGAGISGMYQLYCLRKLGLSVQVLEAGGGVGGTWYWNRYPGARFDSESYSYGYSFSEEILEEWEWSEHFAPQHETLRYLEFVADKFDLRKSISFNKRVNGASWSESERLWHVTCDDGSEANATFLITAIGILSSPTAPDLYGLDRFRGRAFHTAEWPHEPVEIAGKRVGVIGTGATGVQVIQEVAKVASHLTVFQRTPNFCAPLGNSRIDSNAQASIKSSYDQIFEKCRKSYGGFLHTPDDRSVFEVDEDERNDHWERLYYEPGFGIWLGNYSDTSIDPKANALITAFISDKIRQRVNDPETAEKLIPKNHGFGTRRVPLETGYYEIYNQSNVELVDLTETPIVRVVPSGIETITRTHELDLLIFATGFDAVTGSFKKITISGIDGQLLTQKWADGPQTLLGLQVAGFPNMFTLVGPHNAATFCNIPRCIEQNVEWVTDLIKYMQKRDYTRVAATREAEVEWTNHVYEVAQMTLMSKTESWFTGVNQNLPDKPRTFYAYAGGVPMYRDRCDEIKQNDYSGFELS